MSLTLIKEDGTGLANANTYASVADGDAYHAGHLYATPWTSESTERKAIALVMSTKVLDTMFRFDGFRRTSGQALQWPRRFCRDRDSAGGFQPGSLVGFAAYVDETTVPVAVRDAICEYAREILRADRTDAPEGQGLRSLTLDGGMKVIFDTVRPPPMVPALVQAMLGKYGAYLASRSGSVPLVRA